MKKAAIILSLLIALGIGPLTFGQGKLSVQGKVTAQEDGKSVAVENAVIQLKPAGLYAVSSSDGSYRIDNLEAGRYELSIQMIGYVTVDTTIVLSKGSNPRYDFLLKESNFRLQEVSVVAERSKTGEATASKISRQAIDHSQTSSLSDVMQLLPGSAITNPDLSSAKALNLRTAGSSAMNSLGTAIIMDGSPMSNNANMEGFTAAMTGVATTAAGTSTVSAGSVPNSGYDVRSISTDNIESIEIIRGIPSAQYGDLTSGAVIINSKAGAEPLMIRLKTDPKIYQAALSKGFKLKGKAGALHISADFAHSNAKTTESYAYYERLNTKVMYSKLFGSLSTNTSLDLRMGKDTRNANPDDQSTMLATGGWNLGYRFNTSGTWTVNKGWLKTINYSLSNSFTYKESYKEQYLNNATGIYSSNMVSGSTVANEVGKRVYDENGKEITSFNDGNDAVAFFTPYSYFCHYDFYSKEINTFAKLNATFFKTFGGGSNKILVGADFKSDGNLGDGLVFSPGKPPQHSSNPESGYRARPLYDIPFVNQFGAYLEDDFKATILKRQLTLSAGVRFDAVNGLKALSPRINASVELLPGILSLRGGYGITAKAPTSAYLYPNNAYYDQCHYNNGLQGAEQLCFATTYVLDTSNPELKMAKNRKAEVGLDLKIAGRYCLSVTAYDELMENGYTMGSSLNTFVWLPYSYYKMNDAGGLYKITDTHKFFNFYTPLNTAWEHNRGIEFELDLGRFDAIRTSFNLNGAWMHTQTANAGETYEFNYNKGSRENSNVSIFDPFVKTYNYEKFITTLRITHNIPSVGLAITLTTQLNAFTKSWSTFHNDEYPQRYISNADGKVYEFTEEMASDPQYSYMYDLVTPGRFIVSTTIPTVVFNLNLSKEIGRRITASFYVNNLFNSRPLDPSEVSVGSYTELNNPMYFGLELKLKLF